MTSTNLCSNAGCLCNESGCLCKQSEAAQDNLCRRAEPVQRFSLVPLVLHKMHKMHKHFPIELCVLKEAYKRVYREDRSKCLCILCRQIEEAELTGAWRKAPLAGERTK